MKEHKRNAAIYAAAFFIPFLIAVVICIKNGVYPFGDNCILQVDMYHQYAPFFTEMMNKLKTQSSLLYSFRLGLGSDFVALYTYYLASPLNWLLIFCPAFLVIEFMSVLILIKIGLCGLNFAIYLRNHFQSKDISIAVFAAFYALSGYMAAYSWNIMWLDCILLAPIVILGLEKLVKEGNAKLYCISLTVSILSNYYISIMLCIFLVLYYGILFLEETRGKRQKLLSMGRFALYSLLAGGMGAVLILPEIAILGYTGSSFTSFPDTLEWYFDWISMLARHCMDVETYLGSEHWPNLYCGAAVILFLVLYLCNKNISWKKKIKRVILLVVFWLGFSNNIMEFIWHGMDFPDSLPGREVYLYVFFILVTAYEVYHNRQGNTILHIGIGLIVTFGFLAAAAKITDMGNVTADALLLTGVLTVAYALLLILWRIGSGDIRAFAKTMLVVLAILEVFVNFSITGLSTTNRNSYTKNLKSVKTLLARVEEMEEDAFYRVEEMERLTKNDAALYGYASSGIFSSLMNLGVSRFYRLVGMEGGKNFYSYSGATPLISAMLSVKYCISQSPYEESPLRTLVAEDGRNYIYRNAYTLPLGFMVDFDLEEEWNPVSGRPISNLNRFAEVLGAKGSLLSPMEGVVTLGEEKTTIAVSEDCYLYATYADTSVTNITVKNGKRVRKFTKCDHGYILDLGWCKANDIVEITNSSSVSKFQVRPYQLNFDALETAFHRLNAQEFKVDYFEDTKIEGHIKVEKAGNLILSIPKEDGWKVLVDGEEIECQIFEDSFMEIPLPAGEHKVTLAYMTPGLRTGALISIFCLGIFVGICAGEKWKKKESNQVFFH